LKIYRGVRTMAQKRNTFIAIGIFDGVHKGHRKIIEAMTAAARRRGAKTLALTFDPHPLSILNPRRCPPTVISLEHRIDLISSLGVDALVVIKFTKSFSRFTPEHFVKTVLMDILGAREVFVGDNFHFGRKASGNAAVLSAFGKQYGFKVNIVPPVRSKGAIVSSTLIRRLIQSGQLREAERLLGRPCSILGTVVRGSRRGRFLGFPTANIDRPTFSDRKEPIIEVHIMGFDKNIYGRQIEAYFLKRLRNERSFKKKENLILQIMKDVESARKTLRRPFSLP